MPLVQATPEAVQAIEKAEVILFGPGSFLTSIMPPILLPEIIEALKQSQAKKIFIDNLGIEHSPSAVLSLQDRINWINETVGQKIINGAIVQNGLMPENPDPQLKIIERRLRADDISYRHDRTLLCKAIDDLIGEFA